MSVKSHHLLTRVMGNLVRPLPGQESEAVLKIPTDLLEEIQTYLASTDKDGNKKWALYWLDGRHEIVAGPTIEEAFRNAGIGRGALSALDVYTEGPDLKYEWDKTEKSWKKKEGSE